MNQSELIDDLMIKTSGGQMRREEYYEISEQLGGVNLLVFGTGHDSNLWRKSNKNGKTIFLENSDKWIPENSTDVIKVNYSTNIKEYKEIINNHQRLMMLLPGEIVNEKWDVIFVDSPIGCNNQSPGRMQSIYTASIIANKETIVYVHDCHRTVEDLYTKTFFNIEKEFITLRKCKIRN